jgi:hypothetical protein
MVFIPAGSLEEEPDLAPRARNIYRVTGGLVLRGDGTARVQRIHGLIFGGWQSVGHPLEFQPKQCWN